MLAHVDLCLVLLLSLPVTTTPRKYDMNILMVSAWLSVAMSGEKKHMNTISGPLHMAVPIQIQR